MTLLALTAVICFGFAVYNLTCAFADIPTKRTSRMMLLARKQQGVKAEKLLDVYLTKIAGLIAPYLKLDKLKRNKLQRALDIAGMELTPEVYTARAWVTAGAVGLSSLLMAFLIPLMVPVLIGLAVALWFSTYYKVFDFVKKRRKLIENEIPRFALTIGQNLENDRDVLKILTSYRRVAGKDFGAELDQTIADMKTGNYENALIHFETRIGSPMLSDVIRGLIGVLRGDDQRMYFKMICFDMRQIEQNNLKKEAAKRPKKIQRYSMMMLICIMIPSVTFPPYKSLESSQRPNWSVPSGKSTLGAAYLFTMSIASGSLGAIRKPRKQKAMMKTGISHLRCFMPRPPFWSGEASG